MKVVETQSPWKNTVIHLLLHLIVPALIVMIFFVKNWKKAYPVMMLTMLVDLDHLLASPIYDATRCSINFHPLHSITPITVYALLCLPRQTRLIGIGLIIHMMLDSVDCQLTNNIWYWGS